MTGGPSSCADLRQLIHERPRFAFPPPFVELPLNGVYFIFEHGQASHGGLDRVVRVGSHRGWNNLAPRLWQHITPHGRSSFRWDVGAVILASKLPGFEALPDDVWAHCDTVARKPPKDDRWVASLDRFETQLSAYIAKQFTFRTVGTADPAEALRLEMVCIGIVAGCDYCQGVANPYLRPRKGKVLWNSQHIGRGASLLSEKQRTLFKNLPV